MRTLNYLNANSRQTLRQGIEELRAAEGAEGDAAGKVAPELVGDIDAHDAIHVVFGCPTTLVGEVVAHVWTVFGTTTKLRDMHRVTAHGDHRSVLTEIGHRRLLAVWVRSLPRIIGTVGRAWRMRRRWPAEEFADYLDVPLADLRKDFGIQISRIAAKSDQRAGAALRSIRTHRSTA